MEPKHYLRQLSRGANNMAIGLSATEVGKLFGDNRRELKCRRSGTRSGGNLLS